MKSVSNITFSLTHDEALVLLEWLSREDGRQAIPTEHEAEQTVLWKIEGALERALVEVVQRDYAVAVQAARERIKSR